MPQATPCSYSLRYLIAKKSTKLHWYHCLHSDPCQPRAWPSLQLLTICSPTGLKYGIVFNKIIHRIIEYLELEGSLKII